MKTRLLVSLFCILFPVIIQAQQYECFAGDIDNSSITLRSSRTGSAEAFYKDLNNWMPYGVLAPNDPLKNPPIMEIEISFHIFLDNNGGNCAYLNNDEGRNRLIWAFNLMNQIYAGYDEPNYGKGSSDPVSSLVELPGCDTKIRFSLGENNERIYFYNNNSLNSTADDPSLFRNFVQNNFPERATTMNVYFSAGLYQGNTALVGYVPSITKDLVVVCNSNKITNDWITGMLIAHELGHTLDLLHTYCYGGASVVCCSGSSCDQGCIKTTNTSEYLSDIFGPINNSTCPHIANWGSPYDNTIPNANKITNNMMGGSSAQRYISPMQAGQMHRALALTDPIRKYVKKETYSPIPLVINSSEVWDFDLKLYRDIVVSSGSTLTIANTFETPYNGTITVNKGASLVIEKTLSLSESNKLIVKSGGNLTVKSGGTLTFNDVNLFSVELGATFIVEQGGIIK